MVPDRAAPDAHRGHPDGDARRGLRADCARCAALCCVGPALVASADFAIDKPAGTPCPNLRPDHRCGIHDHLRERGFPGCTVFDCFGAGQHVVQVTFGGRLAAAMTGEGLATFGVVRQLMELRWYLAEARALAPAGPLRRDVERLDAEIRRLVDAGAAVLARVDAAAQRARVAPLLSQVSDAARAGVRRRAPDRVRADLTGARLRGADLRGTSLRGAWLLGADLRDADLFRTDLLGADLRGADVRGARLAGSLFLTGPQVAAASGDAATTLPAAVVRPAHWSGPPATRTDTSTGSPQPHPGPSTNAP